MRKTSPNNPLDVSYTTIQMKLNKQNMREFLTHFCETVKEEVNITKYLLKPKTFALQGERKMLEARQSVTDLGSQMYGLSYDLDQAKALLKIKSEDFIPNYEELQLSASRENPIYLTPQKAKKREELVISEVASQETKVQLLDKCEKTMNDSRKPDELRSIAANNYEKIKHSILNPATVNRTNLEELEQGCRNLAVISYTDLIGNYRALAKDLAQSFNQSLVILKQGNKSCDVAGDPIEHEHLQEGGNESDYDLAEYYNECIAKTLILESTTNVKESDGQDSVSMCPRASVRETISLIYNIGFAAANAGKQCFGLSTAWKNCISSIYESEETCLHIPDYLRSDYLCCNADSSISNPSLSHNIYIPYDPGLIL